MLSKSNSWSLLYLTSSLDACNIWTKSFLITFMGELSLFYQLQWPCFITYQHNFDVPGLYLQQINMKIINFFSNKLYLPTVMLSCSGLLPLQCVYLNMLSFTTLYIPTVMLSCLDLIITAPMCKCVICSGLFGITMSNNVNVHQPMWKQYFLYGT